MNVNYLTLSVFVILFAIFSFLGFYGARWRKGDLNKLSEWGLGGRRLGTLLVWFLLGADLFTAYSFIAVPAGIFAFGSLYFFAIPYVAWGFGVALLTMPRLWNVSRNKGYITAADFVKDRFNSRSLAILVALTGVVAELPYIALQIVGMEAVLAVLLAGLGISSKIVTEISLILAFIVLAAFTFVSGLRGAALTGVFKDVLIWITVITVIVLVPIEIGGFSKAFSDLSTNFAAYHLAKVTGSTAPPEMETLPIKLAPAYFSLALGSSFALYLYPHAINGFLSSESEKKLVYSTSFLPIYGIGLALISLFGILVYAVPGALGLIAKTGNGALAVPALIACTMPCWFVGLAFLAIFVGGLVPASIMAIAVANLFVRNVIKEFKPDLPPYSEAKLAKWTSTIFKFLALGFVFVVPATYAIQLQLLGGIIVSQTLPAVFLGLYTDKLESKSLIAGWAAGIISGVGLEYYVNFIQHHFGVFKISLMTTPLGPLFIAIIALAINLAVTLIGTAIAYSMGWRPKSKITQEEIIKTAQ
ncbi:sodium:solute symporter family protein [Acidianus ambivalens]|uniref:Sodium:solute symporter n=1 Tax=Acidianus ambivalens TaxID=2283 RepID=A0A650CY54_ACIAM|nr:sodium:solute symporter [Acidianus ambivalens]MQL54952.1 sodium:solute symporter [Acidianus ambivalens]QGR22736.1 sodium:solute symporter [Acidianus ambivalens]